MVIGISGKIGSGKDTVGKIIQEICLGHNVKEVYESFIKQKDSKLNDSIVLQIKEWLDSGKYTNSQIAKRVNVSPTTITDIKKGRKWKHVGKQIEEIKPILPVNTPNWIITDMRFPNELKAVKDREGITIRVNRLIGKEVYIIENEQPFENWYGTVESYNGNNFYNITNNVHDTVLVHYNNIILQDEHESETALDNAEFDYVIDNNGTIEELIEKVKEILIECKIL